MEAWQAAPPLEARAGDSVGLTLDDQLFVERGEVISHLDSPPVESDVVRARLFWLAATEMRADERFLIKLNTTEANVTVQSIETVIDAASLAESAGDAVRQNAVADVVLRGDRMLALDSYVDCRTTGRFVLVRDHRIVGGGTLNMEGYPNQRAQVSVWL